MEKKSVLIIIFLFSISLVSASFGFDFNISVGNLPDVLYGDESAIVYAQVFAFPDNACDIICMYSFNSNSKDVPDEDNQIEGGGSSEEFGLSVEARGTDFYSEELTVICEKENSWNVFCSGSMEHKATISFPTTYCGNGEVELEHENCGECPEDVGKCDLKDCIYGTECEGKYCIHEICWNKPWREGDNFCDISEGENCKNSKDCSCGTYERCSSSGICETYCGNGQCEESERGICKADCKWCGDGECNNNENCQSCDEDCGVCENEELNEQIANKTREVIKQGLAESSSKQKLIFSVGAIIIILFIVGYLSVKGVKHKSKNGKKTKAKRKKTKR